MVMMSVPRLNIHPLRFGMVPYSDNESEKEFPNIFQRLLYGKFVHTWFNISLSTWIRRTIWCHTGVRQMEHNCITYVLRCKKRSMVTPLTKGASMSFMFVRSQTKNIQCPSVASTTKSRWFGFLIKPWRKCRYLWLMTVTFGILKINHEHKVRMFCDNPNSILFWKHRNSPFSILCRQHTRNVRKFRVQCFKISTGPPRSNWESPRKHVWFSSFSHRVP